MARTYLFRRMTKPEIRQALSLVYSNFPDEQKSDVAKSELMEMFHNKVIKPTFVVCVDRDQNINGLAGFCQNAGDYHLFDLMWVNVAPHLQRRGIGSAMVNYLLRLIPRTNVDANGVMVATSIPRFYNRLGFRRLVSLQCGQQVMFRRLRAEKAK